MVERNREAPSVGGDNILELFQVATAWVEENASAINRINVFPVPDGDTGTNVKLTMKKALERGREASSNHVGDLVAALAEGALKGSRGNSGGILSRILGGAAEALSGKERLTGQDFANALRKASDWADDMKNRQEGTMVTAMREAAAAAEVLARRPEGRYVLAAAVEAMEKAVADSPNLLPKLREAGVVDAGALALLALLKAALHYLKNKSLQGLAPLVTHCPVLAAAPAEGYGFCANLLVKGPRLNAGKISKRLEELGGNSIQVSGRGKERRIHVHIYDWEEVVRYMESLGEISEVTRDDMDAQAQSFVSQVTNEDLPAIGTVAVIHGECFGGIFRGERVTALVSGGRSTDASMEEILGGITLCPQNKVIVLPNDKNVIGTADLAARASQKDVRVVPTEAVTQGLAALLAFTGEFGLDRNVELMDEARQAIVTIEVKTAIRGTESEELPIKVGQALGFVDGKLVVAEETRGGAVRSCLAQVVTKETVLVTIYYGVNVTEEEAQALALDIKGDYPDLEGVEVYFGAQLHPYIISVE